MIGELISRCFHARTEAHILHLQTRSYAEHVALNEFYDGIVDLADSLAEAYQGMHGLIKKYGTRQAPAESGVALIEGLADWIDEHRYDCCPAEDSCLQNIIDEILALCSSSLYKLRFLK